MTGHNVRAKKHLGQHFLNDDNIALKIVESIDIQNCKNVLEIGPGTGVLTKHIVKLSGINYIGIDVDLESIQYLNSNFSGQKFIPGDFLKLDLKELFNGQPFIVIGNFPYNISSQILFKVLDNYELIPETVGMFQKEVAERVAENPGNKSYGLISVILQAYYDIEYLFTVSENVFTPPPKVKSGVIRLKLNPVIPKNFDEKHFKKIVKTAFNQRRKTLRNSLKSYGAENYLDSNLITLRPEQLSVQQFIDLSLSIPSI